MSSYRPMAGYSDGSWSVVRVNDDGRAEPVHVGIREEAASLIAGALRDEQSDEDVGAGWNVVALGRAAMAARLRGDKSRARDTDGATGPKSTMANVRRDPAE